MWLEAKSRNEESQEYLDKDFQKERFYLKEPEYEERRKSIQNEGNAR